MDLGMHIARNWGKEHPIFVDTSLPEIENDHPLTVIFDTCRKGGVQAIPVTGPGRTPEYQDAVRDIVNTDGRGLCLRLKMSGQDETEDPSTASDAILNTFTLSRDQVDLVIDFGAIGPDQGKVVAIAARATLAQLPKIAEWRTLTVAGSSFPLNMINVPGQAITTIPAPNGRYGNAS